jgi:azurin
MSEVAGRLAPQVGAHCLEKEAGGRGVLLGGVPGVPAAEVIILGGGVSGTHAATIALGMGANVTVVDRNPEALRRLAFHFGTGVRTIFSTRAAIVEIQIASIADTMTFDKTKLTVPAGATVHLVLKNNSKLDILPHNWVLVKTGTEAAVAAAGLEKGLDAGYIATGSDVLAYTPLALKLQTTEVTFTAPAAGTYPYICTVPGHYVMMKGVLTVTP